MLRRDGHKPVFRLAKVRRLKQLVLVDARLHSHPEPLRAMP